MTDYAIVAIPVADDPVWKVSSEKVPHMTLLMLGSDLADTDISAIEEFLAHLVDGSLHRFGASVDYRDVLGPKDADVLFFRPDGLNEIKTARANMLMQPNIKMAYNSVEQYPEWTPHLTMGYPETPAKEDTRDYPGIHWVNFDRIALWITDYDGPEFRLEDRWEQSVAMSTTEGDVALEHHGVKGMKWGVVKADPTTGADTGKRRAATTAEIHNARINTNARWSKIAQADLEVRLATTEKGKQAALKVVDKYAHELATSDDTRVAKMYTTGEKITVAIVAGPALGAVLIGHNTKATSEERFNKNKA